MKKNIIKVLASAAMVFGVVTSLHAVPITGHISIGTAGGGVLWSGNTSDVNTITSIITFGSAEVTDRSGSFTTTIANGNLVTMGQPLDFVTPTIINPLWSVGGFSFTLSPPISITRVNNADPIPDTLRLAGQGYITGPAGFDATIGGWTWSGELNGVSTFTFSSTTLAGVPDGGTTVALLGAALSGLALLRRKLA
jgi:VPDSG-CTERM motif